MISEADKQELVVEIFSLTGLKVEVDDPVTLAAFFYSEKLRLATAEHQTATEAMMVRWEQKISKDTHAAVRAISEAATAERKADKRDFSLMIKSAQRAAQEEVPAIKRDLQHFATGLMKGARNIVGKADVSMSIRALLGAVLVAGAAGMCAGYFWFGVDRQPDHVPTVAKPTTASESGSTSIEKSRLHETRGQRHAK